MKPFYRDDWATIYRGDCRKFLKKLDVVDLVLTDPPYGLKWKQTGFQTKFHCDYEEAAAWDKRPNKEVIDAVITKGKQATVWGFNYLADLLGPSNGCLVWDKMTGKNLFADGELAWTNTTGTMRILRHQWCGAFKDSERGKVNVHPTQKPIEVMVWCVGLAKDPGSILDPFMGSGTTLVAAKMLGRKSIGVEIEEKYCTIAAKRLKVTHAGVKNAVFGE